MSGRRLRNAKLIDYREEPDEDPIDPCKVCGRTAQEDCNECSKCGKWVHDKCSRYRKGDRIDDFICPICVVAQDASSERQAKNHCGLKQTVSELSQSNEGHEEDNLTVQPDVDTSNSVESFDAQQVQSGVQSTGITQLMHDLSVSDMSVTNSSNVPPQSTGLTQQFYGLAISDDVLSSEESNELLVDIFPITDSRFLLPTDNEQDWIDLWQTIVTHPCKLYRIPTGRIGKSYVETLAEEIQLLYSSNVPSERCLVFSTLMLHKDPKQSTSKDLKNVIEQRLIDWKASNIAVLKQSFIRCSKSLSKQHTRRIQSRELKFNSFSKMVRNGNIRNASRLLVQNESGVLKPSDVIGDKTVGQLLEEKHPAPAPLYTGTFDLANLPAIEKIFITERIIDKVARRTFGSNGPSGSDANHWFDALIRFGTSSCTLREAVSLLGNMLCNTVVPWRKIKALFSNRLIALDKNPGVRPIGVGETLRRILGKAVADITGDDLIDVFGTQQLAGGVECGIEASIHGLRELFQRKSGEGYGLILLDASNAFNSVNRTAALLNARKLWSRASTFLYNSYQEKSKLIVGHSDFSLYSQEGTTQGILCQCYFMVSRYCLI